MAKRATKVPVEVPPPSAYAAPRRVQFMPWRSIEIPYKHVVNEWGRWTLWLCRDGRESEARIVWRPA